MIQLFNMKVHNHHSRKTELTGENEENKVNTTPRCPLPKADHSLNVCRSFRAKPLQERKDISAKTVSVLNAVPLSIFQGIAKQPSNVNLVGIQVTQQQCTQI